MIIDHIDNIDVSEEKYLMELQSLETLKCGLNLLFFHFKNKESRLRNDLTYSLFPAKNLPPEDRMRMECMFHWYSVSIVNFVRLAKLLRSKVASSDSDISPYEKMVPDNVLNFRNKIGAHFVAGETNKTAKKKDTATDRQYCVMPQMGVENGRYKVGQFSVTAIRSGVTETFDCGNWSLTEVHENLNSRFKFFITKLEKIENSEMPEPLGC